MQNPKGRWNVAAFVGWGAHALAWLAFLWLVLWPRFYVGVTAEVAAPGVANGGEPTPMTASFLEVNGAGVIPILLVPVAVTGLVAVALRRGGGLRQGWWSGVVLWGWAALLLLFCLAGLFSIGVMYLPSALGLLSAVAIGQLTRGRSPRPSAP